MGQSRSLGSAGEGFPLAGTQGWVPAGPPASLAASRQGYGTAFPATSSLRASCHPVCVGGCWPLSPSLGSDLGPLWHNCPLPYLAPSWASNCHKSQHIPSEMLRSKTPLSQPKNPTSVHLHTHSCRRAPHQQVSSCWDWGSRTDLTQPGPCHCPHGAGQCRCQG